MSLGFVLPAAGIGLGALLIRPQRGFFVSGSADNPSKAVPILVPQATISEDSHHELEATEHPVESGAPIADHAYMRPSVVRIRAVWSNSPSGPGSLVDSAIGLAAAVGGPGAAILSAIPSTVKGIQDVASALSGNPVNTVKAVFDALRALQSSRVPFDVFTGKAAYKNMLLQSIAEETTAKSENSLAVVLTCRQVIIVQTRLVAANTDPTKMQEPENNGPVQDLGNQELGEAPTITASPATTLDGAMVDLNAGLSALSGTLADNPAISNLPGALGQVGGITNNLTGSLADLASKLPAPFEIPTISSSGQEFGISLSGIDLSGPVGDSLKSFKSDLDAAAPIVDGSLLQLNSAGSIVPPAVAEQLDRVQSNIANAQAQVKRALGL